MLRRCNNPHRHNYADYGGRGVKVCADWDPTLGGSFENFFRSMGPKPGPKYQHGSAMRRTAQRIKKFLGNAHPTPSLKGCTS